MSRTAWSAESAWWIKWKQDWKLEMSVSLKLEALSMENKRFVQSTGYADRDCPEGANSYVANLSQEGKEWLLTKPFCTDDHAAFFFEMYQVLNLIQAAEIPAKGKVLEVGSGPGWVTELLVKLRHDVDCVEPSIDMLRIAEQRLEALPEWYDRGNVTFHCSTLEEFSGGADQYDVAIFHESLHHLVDERTALKNVYNMLRPGGRIAIDEYAWIPGDTDLESNLLKEMEEYGTLENPYTAEYLDALLTEIGFGEIKRLHMINGFLEKELGGGSVESQSQAPSRVTNNLVATKPIPGVTSTWDRECSINVDLIVRDVRWLATMHRLELSVDVENGANTRLLSGRNGRPGGVYFALTHGSKEGSHYEAADRNPLPRELGPGEAVTAELVFAIPVGQERETWRLEMVAEHRFWFSDKKVEGIELVPYIGDTP